MERLILNSQKKQIFETLKESGFEPANFEWETVRGHQRIDVVSRLKCKNTEYFFTFDFMNDMHYGIYSPGHDKPVDSSNFTSWDGIQPYFRRWLINLRREIDTGDPWEEIEKYIPGANVDLEGEKSNEPFSYAQVEHITKALNDLKEKIVSQYQLQQEQTVFVQDKLDYLIDRVKNLGKIDWKNIFVSTIMTIAVQLALSPEQAKQLWGLVSISFRGILLLSDK